jgi:hypothetical protein
MKTLILSLILSLSLSSCAWIKSLGPEEPFYCKINSEKFRPQKDDSPIGGWGSKPLKASIDKDYHWLYIQAINSPELISISIKLNQDNKVEIGEYQLVNDISNTSASFYLDYTAEPNQRERLVSTSGKVTISKVEGIYIYGTFDFSCKSTKTASEYKITEGQFNKLSYF